MTRFLPCLLLLVAACEFEIDNTSTTTEDRAAPSGPRFETPPTGRFTVRPLPADDGPDGRPGRKSIEAMLKEVERGHWEFLALEYVFSEARRLRVDLGERVAIDAPPNRDEESPWLLGLSDEVSAGKPVTVVAAHRPAGKGRRVRIWVFGGEGRGRADRGEVVPVSKPAAGVSAETLVEGDHAPPFDGVFFKMVTPDIGSGFLTSGGMSPFALGVWAHAPVDGGSSTSFRHTNGVKSVSFASGDVAIDGDGVQWTIRVNGQPVDVVDYPHVAWVFRGSLEPCEGEGD